MKSASFVAIAISCIASVGHAAFVKKMRTNGCHLKYGDNGERSTIVNNRGGVAFGRTSGKECWECPEHDGAVCYHLKVTKGPSISLSRNKGRRLPILGAKYTLYRGSATMICFKRIFLSHREPNVNTARNYYKAKEKELDDRKRILGVCVDVIESYRKYDQELADRVLRLEKAMLAMQKTQAECLRHRTREVRLTGNPLPPTHL